jgi:hypothetical protein
VYADLGSLYDFQMGVFGTLARGRAAVSAVCAVWLAGCATFGGGGAVARPFVAIPEAPSDQVKCKVAAQHENPLVTEWPASEKANLEGLLRDGTVVVSYSGCTMRLMPQCRAGGRYVWRRTTVSSDNIEIRDADELYAKLPLGAASLEGELQRSGRLAVQTTVSGQMQLAEFDPNQFPADVACLGATHVLSALSVGAFKLKSGGGADVRGNASVAGFGTARGESRRDESLMREAGSPEKCELGTDTAADAACASPIQVFLRPLPRLLADRGLPGMMKVRFLPVRGDLGWDVGSGERLLCETPCERWVDPAIPFNYRKNKELVELPDLREHAAVERVQLEVHPTKTVQKVLGIVGASLFGATAASGTVFTSVGFGGDDPGFKTAGLITLPIGLVGLAASIYAIATSGSHVDVSAWDGVSDGMPPPEPR